MSQNDLLNAQDDFHRLLSQAKALVLVLASDDSLKSFNKDIVSDALYLVSDRLDDIGAAYEQTVREVAA